MKDAKTFIKKQLKDLNVPEDCRAYVLTFENAAEAADIMTKAELKKYIEDYINELPSNMFS